MRELAPLITCSESALARIEQASRDLVVAALSKSNQSSPIQSLLHEYQLSSEEGLALMSLTEALMRIPDEAVAAQLIADRIKPLNWSEHMSSDQSTLINASTLLLALSGKLLTQSDEHKTENYAHKLLRKLSQPIIRKSMTQVLKVVAEQFVFAENLPSATNRISNANKQKSYSIDMLGEASVCLSQADSYMQKYQEAIKSIGQSEQHDRCSISVKLSAIHPHYQFRKIDTCVPRIVEKLLLLYQSCKQFNVDLTIDAEEANRLELSLAILDQFYEAAVLEENARVGLAVQAYSKRALPTLKWLRDFAQKHQVQLPLRLVKGAYWDSEIKYAQQQGLPDYPVFTAKPQTDLSYLACAHYLLEHSDQFYPQFATHNVISICHISEIAGEKDYEFQHLHGMGEDVYESLLEQSPKTKVRIYAPVGQHKELLPYLVRRILENGANNSFVHLMSEQADNLDQLVQHPLIQINIESENPIPRPVDTYEPVRSNSYGLLLESSFNRNQLLNKLSELNEHYWEELPLSTEKYEDMRVHKVHSLCDGREIGEINWGSPKQALQCLAVAKEAFPSWTITPPSERAQILIKFALLLESNQVEFIALLVEEAGKTIEDAHNEIREAIDFANYYAKLGECVFQTSNLPSIDGESNELQWQGKGVFLCISPWNFPLAIFSGQVCAALMAGNCVIAKPAEQTPLIARRAVECLWEAGVPQACLHMLPGEGHILGKILCTQPNIAGVAFTGSTATAKSIHQNLANREGPIATLIAETGGQNAMIVDSSAVLEQLVTDVITSAFFSAGQRCSALRMLYVQKEIYPEFKTLLAEAVEEITLGDPRSLATDIGPIIDGEAKEKLQSHIAHMHENANLVCKTPWDKASGPKNILAPHVFEIENISQLHEEHFGPVLHIAPFAYDQIDHVIEDINKTGYGLTFGIHSRNEAWAKNIAAQINAGNIYINRNIVGAVVGSQPFGGRGLSGTGPKAGGPNYLQRFANEVTMSNNTAAIGGNVKLLT